MVANLPRALGQEVLPEAMEKGQEGEGADGGGLTGFSRDAEGELIVFQLEQATVAEGDSKAGGGQIGQGRLPGADRLTGNDPGL